MRNKWYGDNRDLVKWSILIHLARMTGSTRIIQIAYFRHDDFEGIEIDEESFEIPAEVKGHFRNIRRIENLSSNLKINVFDMVLENREGYLDQAKSFIASFSEQCVVFLDPDTGLEPPNPNLNHVLEKEIKEFWANIKSGDVLVFYQHQTNRANEPWIGSKKKQFESAIIAPTGTVRVAHGFNIARDVVFFYIRKP